MAPSISLDQAGETMLRFERRLMKRFPEVTIVVTRVGRGEVGAHTDPVNSAEMYLFLQPKEKWRVDSQAELEDVIRDHLGEVPGVLTNFTQPIAMRVDELVSGVVHAPELGQTFTAVKGGGCRPGSGRSQILANEEPPAALPAISTDGKVNDPLVAESLDLARDRTLGA